MLVCLGDDLGEPQRFLDRLPAGWALCAVAGDPIGHFGVARLPGGEEDHRLSLLTSKRDGEARLAAAGAAEDEHQRHRLSTCSNACTSWLLSCGCRTATRR